MNHIQQTFNPANFGFEWTADGWYSWDRAAAHKAAMQARNARAKALKAEGRRVVSSAMAGQLITRGGIGSGFPEISLVCTVYMVQAL